MAKDDIGVFGVGVGAGAATADWVGAGRGVWAGVGVGDGVGSANAGASVGGTGGVFSSASISVTCAASREVSAITGAACRAQRPAPPKRSRCATTDTTAAMPMRGFIVSFGAEEMSNAVTGFCCTNCLYCTVCPGR